MNWKSVWAVVAGALFGIVVTTVVDVILHVVHIYPPLGEPMNGSLAILATAYRIPIGVAGAYLTASLAPSKPMKHAMILGVIGGLAALIGAIVTWNKDLGPRWYAIGLVVLALPQCWLGAKLFESRGTKVAQIA